jgi:transposase
MITIPVVTERCAGIDVGKRGLAVARLTGPVDKEGLIETRWFGTTVPELESLKEWLLAAGVTTVAMESTASYWIPVKNVLESSLHILLVCPKKHHPKKGEKTDFRDAVFLAHQHRHGMLTGSYLPEKGVAELRDLTRRRKKLQGNLGAEKNRVQKTLEVANVKIGNVIGDVFGVSGQEMVDMLLSGRKVEPCEIAELAKARLRTKIPQLTETLEGHHMNDHHRWLIRQSVDHIVLLDGQMEALEERIMEQLRPYRREFDLMCTIPGVKDLNAAAVLAEIGPDMTVFPTGDQLCSWGGICSGNNRSAGKNRSGKTKKANKFLRSALVQAAWGAVRKDGSIFKRKFNRWTKKMGAKKAIVAVSHSLLKVIWAVLRSGQPYQERDQSLMNELERQKLVRHHARRLRDLGAEAEVIDEVVERLLYPVATPATEPNLAELAADAGLVSTSIEPGVPALPTEQPVSLQQPEAAPLPLKGRGKVCRGKLGFRARQTKNEYSDVKEQPGNGPLTGLPGNNAKLRRTRKKANAKTAT